MTVNKNAGAPSDKEDIWHAIKWQKRYRIVKRLQARIVKAIQEGRWNKVRALQRLLTCSFSGKVIAVRRVTENKGKRTAGVDGAIWKTPTAKYNAINLLKKRGYKPDPLRRIYISKADGNKRPLSIPTMKDRAMQALHKLALDPVAESTADRHSYGFRSERSTFDAIEQCYAVLSRQVSPKWILEADIQGCFDNISHEWLISNVFMDKSILRKWLKAGFMESNILYATEQGTPQGGIISPLLANIALDGLGKKLGQKFPMKISSRKPAHKVNFIRYCDDFIVTGRSKEQIETEILPLVKEFLSKRGLNLSEKKTKLTYIEDGFDFLGYNIRKYHKDGRLIIIPSKDSYKRVMQKIRAKIKKYKMARQEEVIMVVNPIIRGWTNYYRHVCAKSAFSKLRHDIWKALWKWSKRRHNGRKSRQWIKDRYFIRSGGLDWCFVCKRKDGTTTGIVNPARVKIERHVKVKADLNPYDDNWQNYLEGRTQLKMLKSLNADKKLSAMWRSQKGTCPICKQLVTKESEWEVHHILEKSRGGDDRLSNLIMLHPNCHKQVHSQNLKVTKPGLLKGLTRGLSRMKRNLPVRFLEGGAKVTLLSYSTLQPL